MLSVDKNKLICDFYIAIVNSCKILCHNIVSKETCAHLYAFYLLFTGFHSSLSYPVLFMQIHVKTICTALSWIFWDYPRHSCLFLCVAQYIPANCGHTFGFHILSLIETSSFKSNATLVFLLCFQSVIITVMERTNGI